MVDTHLDSVLHKQRTERNLGSKQQMLKTVLNCKTLAQIKKDKICQEKPVYSCHSPKRDQLFLGGSTG